MGKNGWEDEFNRSAVRHAITKNITERFPEVMDEIVVAFSDTVAGYANVDGDGADNSLFLWGLASHHRSQAGLRSQHFALWLILLVK